MNEKRIDVLGVGFDNFTMEEAVDEGVRLMNEPGAHYVVTPNPEIVEICREDADPVVPLTAQIWSFQMESE